MDGTEPIMRMDGSIIDLTENIDGTLPLPTVLMPEQQPSEIQGEEIESMDVDGEVVQDPVMDDSAVEEPLTPATDNTCSSKSLPGSGLYFLFTSLNKMPRLAGPMCTGYSSSNNDSSVNALYQLVNISLLHT